MYSFERRQSPDSPSLGVKIARARDLAGYVRWRLSDGNGCVIRDFQTVHLSGRENDMRTARATGHDLHLALERLTRLAFFGVVELFEDSISKMSGYLTAHFSDVKMSYAVVNRSPEREGTLEERLQQFSDAIGPDLYQELLDKNALDLQLYNAARRYFSREPWEEHASFRREAPRLPQLVD